MTMLRAFSIAILLCVFTQAFAQAPIQMELDGTSIIGDKELPNVLYVVPWKDPEPMPMVSQDGERGGGMLPAQLRRHVMQRQLRQRMEQATGGDIE